MKLCPMCQKVEISDEEQFCPDCKAYKEKLRKQQEETLEETLRRRQLRNRAMGNNQRRH